MVDIAIGLPGGGIELGIDLDLDLLGLAFERSPHRPGALRPIGREIAGADLEHMVGVARFEPGQPARRAEGGTQPCGASVLVGEIVQRDAWGLAAQVLGDGP